MTAGWRSTRCGYRRAADMPGPRCRAAGPASAGIGCAKYRHSAAVHTWWPALRGAGCWSGCWSGAGAADRPRGRGRWPHPGATAPSRRLPGCGSPHWPEAIPRGAHRHFPSHRPCWRAARLFHRGDCECPAATGYPAHWRPEASCSGRGRFRRAQAVRSCARGS
ncbi:hypothetical protein D3C87_1413390 [compost metagenome]